MKLFRSPWMSVALASLIALFWGNARSSSGLAEYDQPWEVCALCHSLDGNSRMAKFPKLAGQPAAYIEKQIYDFLEGRRQNDGGQMSAIVTEIDTSDIKRIAGWFASQTAPPHEGDVRTTRKGQKLYEGLGCSACHDRDNALAQSFPVPYLSAQHAQYLAKQLLDFQQGNRQHLSSMAAQDSVEDLTQDDISDLVTYLAATPRE